MILRLADNGPKQQVNRVPLIRNYIWNSGNQYVSQSQYVKPADSD